jgi:hypothetical protein
MARNKLEIGCRSRIYLFPENILRIFANILNILVVSEMIKYIAE